MFLTPVEIQHQPLRDRGRGGYDRGDVDNLLETAAASYEEVWRERDELRRRITELEEELSSFRESERFLRETLVTAQRNADELRVEAKKEADLLARDAQAERERAQTEAEQERERAKAEAEKERERAKAEAEQARERAKAEAEQARDRAKAEAAKERERAKVEAEQELEEVCAEIKRLRSLADEMRSKLRAVLNEGLELADDGGSVDATPDETLTDALRPEPAEAEDRHG